MVYEIFILLAALILYLDFLPSPPPPPPLLLYIPPVTQPSTPVQSTPVLQATRTQVDICTLHLLYLEEEVDAEVDATGTGNRRRSLTNADAVRGGKERILT